MKHITRQSNIVGLLLVLVLLAACSASTLSAAPAAQTTATPVVTTNISQSATAQQPNIIFILTDDMTYADLAVMPKLKALVTDQGASFTNYFLNVTLCCPSRSSILRGQYNHNTTIFGNSPPQGGFQKFYQLGEEKSTVAVWLHDAGYRTMLAGKYLNGYPKGASETYIPPGWDEWYSAVKGNAYGEFNYTLNENGKLVPYGGRPEDYGTDVYGHKAMDFIQRTAHDGKPFFIYLATYAPHQPATPAPRDANKFLDAKLPQPPNFNEDDVSDKPAYIRNRPTLTDQQIAQLQDLYRKRLQSLQAVDDLVENLVNTLKATGQLDNTYIFFSSDNGFHLGQHRLLQGKTTAYEEDIRVPLIVRGPGVPAGKTVDALVGNVDLAPTWAELAAAKAPDFVDGRSLVPFLQGNAPAWRTAYLIQHGNPDHPQGQQPKQQPKHPKKAQTAMPRSGTLEQPDNPEEARGLGVPDYYALRTKDYTYVEYITGEKELYDLNKDPYELWNIASTASHELLNQLSAILAQFHQCKGATCRMVDAQPITAKP